jgi:hypothetical protein
MALDDEYFIDGSPRSNAAPYINHSPLFFDRLITRRF